MRATRCERRTPRGTIHQFRGRCYQCL